MGKLSLSVQKTMSVDLEKVNISGLQSGGSAGTGKFCLCCSCSPY